MALFTTPEFDAIVELIISGLDQVPGLETGPGSDARKEAEAWAKSNAQVYDFQKILALNVTPLDATLEGLEVWSVVVGLPRKGGVNASRDQALQITGQSPGGQVIPAGTILQTQSGVQYETLALVACPGVAPYQVNANIQAVEAGTNGNIDAGEKLTFVSPPVGVNDTVDVVLDLANGTDEESEGDWRARILAAFQEKFGGGRRSDYEQWALQVDWVHRVWIYPQKPSINSVGIVAVKAASGASMIATTGERDELLAYIEERKPETDDVTWHDIFLENGAPKKIHSETAVILAPGYATDWTNPLGGITLAAWDAATSKVTTNETLPTDFQAGDMITLTTVNATALQTATGQSARITAVLSTTEFTVAPLEGSVPFGHTPVVGDVVWPSSQALVDARGRILDGDADGCSVGGLTPLNQLGPANPELKYGSWLADISEADISAMARSLAITTPTTTITGAVGGLLASVVYPFPANTTVDLLIPGQVWVRV